MRVTGRVKSCAYGGTSSASSLDAPETVVGAIRAVAGSRSARTRSGGSETQRRLASFHARGFHHARSHPDRTSGSKHESTRSLHRGRVARACLMCGAALTAAWPQYHLRLRQSRGSSGVLRARVVAYRVISVLRSGDQQLGFNALARPVRGSIWLSVASGSLAAPLR